MYLLKLEWKKMVPNKGFRMAMAMYFILLPLMFMAVKASHNDNGRDNNNAAINMLLSNYQFPKIWDSVAYWASWLTFFLLIYIAVWMVTAEHEFRTARQNLITGMERNQYLFGKMQMLLVLITGCTLYMGLVAFIFGAIAGGYGDTWSWLTFEAMRNFFLQNLFYTSFAFLLAVWFRKSGIATIIFYAYILIIERIVYYLIFLQLLEDTIVANFLPASSAWFSLPFYMFKANNLGMMQDVGFENIRFVDESTACIAILCYTVLFWLLIFGRYNQKDL